MESDRKSSLEGLRIVSFESRRAREMAELIRNYGGEPIIAPSMREIPLSENRAAVDFIDQLDAGAFDYLILLTGVGTRTRVEAVAGKYSREKVTAALQKTTLIVRGPKPVAALKELGLTAAISAPEPNTWRELLAELDSKAEIKGKRVAVQEYGITNQELLTGLESRGAKVSRVPVYRWALPEDTGPLRSAIRRILDAQADIVLFTNATQVEHVFRVAKEEKVDQRLPQAFGRMLIASIGPVCSEALEHLGVRVDLEPEHPKMGHLVSALGQRARLLLQAKRAQ
ncbi:MAG: uroporphyrinogen-III synthase [Acidobacteriota bacterium]